MSSHRPGARSRDDVLVSLSEAGQEHSSSEALTDSCMLRASLLPSRRREGGTALHNMMPDSRTDLHADVCRCMGKHYAEAVFVGMDRLLYARLCLSPALPESPELGVPDDGVGPGLRESAD